jgi:hypothetical protein
MKIKLEDLRSLICIRTQKGRRADENAQNDKARISWIGSFLLDCSNFNKIQTS